MQFEVDKRAVVFGIYRTKAELESCIDRLRISGFRNSDISILFPFNDQNRDFSHIKTTKASQGVTSGAFTGATVGGVLGWLAGIGTLAVPGIGALVAAGPIIAALTGAGIGGAFGGVTGALIGLGIPEDEASRYENQIKEGGILLSVHCDDEEWEDKADDILNETNAQDIVSTTEVQSINEEDEKLNPLYY